MNPKISEKPKFTQNFQISNIINYIFSNECNIIMESKWNEYNLQPRY